MLYDSLFFLRNYQDVVDLYALSSIRTGEVDRIFMDSVFHLSAAEYEAQRLVA